MTHRVLAVWALVAWLGTPALVSAQVNGHASVTFDALPDPDPVAGAQPVAEARMRLFAEHRNDWGEHLRVVLAGHVDGLLARRGNASVERAAVARPLDMFAELVWPNVEIRAGASRIVWGRLDEFQPTDVINPIDLSRFLLEGRSEARLAVGLVRTRVFLPASTTLDVVVVPAFRAGRFDQLDEPSSPFNLGVVPGIPVDRRQPTFGASSAQAGVRLTTTTGRVDWGATVYRGLRAFPTVTASLPAAATFGPPTVVETFSRFTMVGGDFETVRGAWGLRGEVAAFVDDTLQSSTLRRGIEGRSIDAGLGVDRRAGNYRLATNVLLSHRSAGDSAAAAAAAAGGGDPGVSGTDVSIVVAADRSFSRETRTFRLFGVYDPTNDTTFVRGIGAASLRDDVWLEVSGGLFAGSSVTTLGRLARRDFMYAKLKVYF